MPKIIESKIIINAPIQKVWDVLADFEKYPQWNPFTPKIEIQPDQLGSDVILHVRLNPKSPKLTIQKEQLLAWDQGQQMSWGITKTWYIQTVRIQKLTALDSQTTEYYTSDAFEGPLTWLVLLLFQQKIQIGFDKVAAGLKRQVECS